MLKFERVIYEMCSCFRYAQEYTERLDCEAWVQYNPKTGTATYTESAIIAAARRESGSVDVGYYVSGKLEALK